MYADLFWQKYEPKFPGQCEMLSEFPHPVLPLPCNIYISVTSL